jgi:hypothetical protein
LTKTSDPQNASAVSWSLDGDPKADIDPARVGEFLSSVYNLYAQESVDPVLREKDFTASAPWIRIQSDPERKPSSLEIFLSPARKAEDGTVHLKTLPGGLVYEVSAAPVDNLLKKDKEFFLKPKSG